MKKPAFKAREILLMLLPAIILAGVAILLRGKPGVNPRQSPGPFSFVVEKMEYETLTAEDVSRGYSKKLKFVLNYKGATPPWWGKASPSPRGGTVGIGATSSLSTMRHLGKPGWWITGSDIVYRLGQKDWEYQWGAGRYGIMSGPPQYDEALDRYVMRFWLPLSEIPDKYGQLTFKGLVGAGHDVTPLSVVVRKAGEKIKPPAASRYSPVILDKVEVETKKQVQTELTVILKNRDDVDPKEVANPVWSQQKASIITGNGKTYEIFPDSSRVLRGVSYTNIWFDSAEQRYRTTYGFNMTSIPASDGKLTFTTKMSVNGCWPIQVSYVVRDGVGQASTPISSKPQVVQTKTNRNRS